MSGRPSFEPSREAARRALDGFEEAYGGGAAGLVRAPGRVNLIGEHIDYCGLTVLPMALRRAVWLAYGPRDDSAIRVATEAPGLAACTFEASHAIPPGPTGDWGNYVRAAIQATVPYTEPVVGRGFDAFVASDLPIASGLSSSSALVVASALAWLDTNGVPVGSREKLATRLAEGERYVGTAGGGMDQAACLLGRAGHALAIDFSPLSVRHMPIPSDWRFVIAHSGRAAEKSGAAQDAYNERTREAAAAADVVAAAMKDPAEDRGLDRYRGLLARHRIEDLLSAAAATLGPDPLKRFRHIVTEAGRVRDAVASARDHDLSAMGGAMLASHASLRDDYEVSTPVLDVFVEAATAAGAAGARLTGAGMGGCAIALCESKALDGVLEALMAVEVEREGQSLVFEARADGGAVVYRAGGEGAPATGRP